LFNRVPEKVPRRSGKLWCRARSGSTGFRRRFRRRSGRLGAKPVKPGQVQQSSEEGSGEGLGGFGAEPVKLNRVLEKVPEKVAEKVPGGFGAKAGRVPEKVPEKVGEALVQPGQVQQGSGEGSSVWLRSTLQKDL